MAKATIIDDLGSGQYTIQRNWAGRDEMLEKIAAYNAEADRLQSVHDGMPETTDDEIFQKRIVLLQIESLRIKAIYLQNNMPEDAEINAWCADYTEGLTGEVGTIDIAGEYTADVNIRPGDIDSNAYSSERDGELYPAIALGPWTSFLNQCIYPGWQKFAPLHRYGWIVDGTIDYENDTCAVVIQSTFSLMNYNVNKSASDSGVQPAAGGRIESSKIAGYYVNVGDSLGIEQIELIQDGVLKKSYNKNFFVPGNVVGFGGFIDFVERNPSNPISTISFVADPIVLSDEQYIQITRICNTIDSWRYDSDMSGYRQGDYWNVMYDLGDPWFWTPAYEGEEQSEFTFGNVTLEYDTSGARSGRLAGIPTFEARTTGEYYWGYKGDSYERNRALIYEQDRYHYVGPKQKRYGDCEDFALSKMQAIIEAGIVARENLMILLCFIPKAKQWHACLGILTKNYGILVSDIIEPGRLWKIEQLITSGTHQFGAFSKAPAISGDEMVSTQVLLIDVPIEYMDCNSSAFVDDDEVVVQFEGQSWDNPKIIGFKENPAPCSGSFVFPGQNSFGGGWMEEESRTLKLIYNSESWAWKNAFPRNYSYAGEDQFARVGYAATGENGLGFTVGGRTISDSEAVKYFFNHLDIFDSVAETFSIGQDYQQEIYDLTFNSLKNGICIAHGGRNSASTTGSDRTYRYQISSNSWNYRDKGDNVYNHASFMIDSVVYIVGGNNGNPLAGGGSYGADNFGFGISDYFTDFRGRYIAHHTMEAYNDNLQTWSQKTTCPVANHIEVKGWSIEGKGLVGGGARTYEYDEDVYAGYETFYSCPGGGKYLDIDDALDECGQDYYKERLQVHWVHLDTGLKNEGSTHIYDNLTESWTTTDTSPYGARGDQATSSANKESVALAFSLGTSYANDWAEYNLLTNTWKNNGDFSLYVINDIGEEVTFTRWDAAGAEL